MNRCCSRLLKLVAVSVILAFASASSAGAAFTANTPPSIATVTSPSFTVQLTGAATAMTAASTLNQHNSGWKSGWSISVTGKPFTCQSGSCTVGAVLANSVSVSAAPTDACDAGVTCTLATNALSAYPIAVALAATPPAAVKFYSVAATTGVGNQTVTIPWEVSVSSSAHSGQYASTWTITLANSP